MIDRMRAAELDARERDAAVTDAAALVRYERKWALRLAKLQLAHPGRWRVPGLSDEELRDELTLRLLEALRTQPDGGAEVEAPPEKEWGLAFLELELRRLRAKFKLKIVLEDPVFAFERGPDEEARMLEQESARLYALAGESAERCLTRPQQRWLAALKMSARSGAFFEASGKPNLAAASRLLDKNRSSALRAFEELSRRFTRELEKLEL